MADIFNLDDLSVSGTYTPQGGGAAVAVRVIQTHAAEEADILRAGTNRAARTAAILKSEVPTKPLDGATLVVGAEPFRIRSARSDRAGTVWTLDIDKQ
jgi:hypothetical protein